MAQSVTERLELDSYESGLAVSLITNHLEMSAALRRDIFDEETVSAFAGKVHTPEALRMLTLFTYADINAVHPDALTPWKAENLWQLYIATANYLDRSVDDERLGAQEESELVHRVVALLPGQKAAVGEFLEGFPERYVLTRTPEQVRAQFKMSTRFAEGPGAVGVSLFADGERVDAGDAEPAAVVCDHGGRAGGLGDEYRYRGRVFEPTGRGGRHVPLYR